MSLAVEWVSLGFSQQSSEYKKVPIASDYFLHRKQQYFQTKWQAKL